jgi:hypothetical protein
MKRDYRACVAKERQSLYATGGGPREEITPYPFADLMEQLVELSAKGLVNYFDGDALEGKKINPSFYYIGSKKCNAIMNQYSLRFLTLHRTRTCKRSRES